MHIVLIDKGVKMLLKCYSMLLIKVSINTAFINFVWATLTFNTFINAQCANKGVKCY